jgi:hypothetical protein
MKGGTAGLANQLNIMNVPPFPDEVPECGDRCRLTSNPQAGDEAAERRSLSPAAHSSSGRRRSPDRGANEVLQAA